MQIFHGIPVSPGIAVGHALVVDNERFRISRRLESGANPDDEVARFHQAIKQAECELAERRDEVTAELGPRYGAIFAAHVQMVGDTQLVSAVEDQVRRQRATAEYAVSVTLRKFAKVFQRLGNAYFAERANDIFDIEKLLLGHLLGNRREELSRLTSPVIVLANDLTPGETARLDRGFVLGFVTQSGGAGGHTAIVAEGLEIPAVVGVGPFLGEVSGGDTVIVDGDGGMFILQPDAATEARYRDALERVRHRAKALSTLRDLPAENLDGRCVELSANIEFPQEVVACRERGAAGVGLYRTEFLYLGAAKVPTEDDHFEAYRHVAADMAPRPVIVRTLDLGADKIDEQRDHSYERNPFLGLRSIRLSLRHTDVFRTQLRAILRASHFGDLRVMFPLISTLTEWRQARKLLWDCMDDLDREGVPINREIPVGIMVEVPAAVVMLDRFLKEVDFISIGTNDLVQYTLAVDRSNKDVASLYSAADPSVIRMIHTAVGLAERFGKPVSLCGQMSASPLFVGLLLGLGLRSLSVPPSAIPEIKRIVRALKLSHCRQMAERALELDSADEVEQYLRDELALVVPASLEALGGEAKSAGNR
ncbi:MAG: phosphoenolpyruvate--protein phosphotransferase [Planctomycetales bacterium]|nr:phosphoenolpyruvate--protein phosphotransferase [Planctomycetales bacterium]